MTGCYLCGGSSYRQRPGCVRDDPSLKVLECEGCGLVFLSSFRHIDTSHYAQSGMHGGELPPVRQWLLEASRDDDRRFRVLREKLTGKTILDFGCGAGGYLLKAREVAAKAEGVEPELRLHPYFEKVGLKVWKDIEGVADATSRFDVITAFHVVEHLADPRTALAKLAALLEGDGELIIEVPNSEDALLTLYECEAFERFAYWSQHLFLFNAETLGELVRQVGLKLRWLKQIQRYPLSNHLYWLARGKPGGHAAWYFLNSTALEDAYSAQLAAVGRCDSLLAGIGSH